MFLKYKNSDTMKKIKTTVIIILFMTAFHNNSYSYLFTIVTPKPCQDDPSFIHHPDFVLNCSFFIYSSHPFDSDTILYKIFAEQNGNSAELGEGICISGQSVSRDVNLQNFMPLCFNETAAIRIDAKRSDNLGVTYSERGYFIDYKSGKSCEYFSKSDGSITHINTSFIPVEFRSICGGLATSVYFIKRNKITFTLTGNFNDSVPVIEKSLCLGYSGSGPNSQQRWAGMEYISGSECRIITFTYEVVDMLGRQLGNFPCNPGKAAIVYRFIRKPEIFNLTVFPNPPSPGNNNSVVACNLQNGNGSLVYSWRDSNTTQYPVSGYFSGNKFHFSVNFNSELKNSFRQEDQAYYVFSRVENEAGSTNWKKIKIRFRTNPVSCPVISYSQDTGYVTDNSILVKSYYTPQKIVRDFLILENPDISLNDRIRFGISETSSERTELNYLSLTQVIVNKDEYAATDETGQVINFKSDFTGGKIIKNEGDDITGLVEKDDDRFADLTNGDKIRVSLPKEKNVYLIMRLMSPANKEDIAGTVYSGEAKPRNFFSRDNMNTICLKIENNPSYESEILIKQDVSLNFLAVTENLNTYTSNSIPMISATGGTYGDITKLIEKIDGDFFTVNNENGINLEFTNISVPENKRAFYICSTAGRIIPAAENSSEKETKGLTVQQSNKLYNNEPNPFNPTTNIRFEIKKEGMVKLGVYDISGRELRTLVNEFRIPGMYEVKFDGSDFASGVYFYKIETPGFKETKRMILIK